MTSPLAHIRVPLTPPPQVHMFVRVSGLEQAGISVPRSLLYVQETPTVVFSNTCNKHSVTLALCRWLAPHPLALARDQQLRPLCPSPFDINHALWTFEKTDRQRGYFSDHHFARQLHMFPGSESAVRRLNADSHKNARYDLIPLETMDAFTNCTVEEDNILETITLPFT